MTRKRAQRRTYTGVSAKCMVYTIEFVVDIELTDTDESLQRALDDLQAVGGAEVIDKMAVSEDFDTACEILKNRSRYD